MGVSESSGGDAFVGFEGFDKIADVTETAGKGDVGYALAGVQQLLCRFFNAVFRKIFKGGFARHILEKTAKVLGGHINHLCHIRKGDCP